MKRNQRARVRKKERNRLFLPVRILLLLCRLFAKVSSKCFFLLSKSSVVVVHYQNRGRLKLKSSAKKRHQTKKSSQKKKAKRHHSLRKTPFIKLWAFGERHHRTRKRRRVHNTSCGFGPLLAVRLGGTGFCRPRFLLLPRKSRDRKTPDRTSRLSLATFRLLDFGLWMDG